MQLDTIQAKLGYTFSDTRLLVKALTHRSFLNEKDKPEDITEHNERLEFLGDAVLELVITDLLYAQFPENEGFLTSLRASLVNYKIVGWAGNQLGLENDILISRGEREELGKARLTIVADAVEAVIGAIYLDGGIVPATEFIKQNLWILLPEILATQSYKDSKSRLQETAQKHFKITPRYKLIQTEGKDHEKIFRVVVMLNDRFVAEGEGRSKQDAEIEAATNALEILQKEIPEIEADESSWIG